MANGHAESDEKPKRIDGPLLPSPDDIYELPGNNVSSGLHPSDIDMEGYRPLWKARIKEVIKQGARRKKDIKLLDVVVEHYMVDMYSAHGQPDELISRAVERHYVGAKIYLIPELFGNASVSPSTLQRYGRDWGANARGIYYRHHYSPEWVTADHSLWLPSFRSMEWDDASEADRRLRAKLFLRHNLDNERWGKSEYSWEADAWTDVFGGMRNDPVLAVDKHEYNTMGQQRHPVSCLLTGDSKFIKRIPDATFGLTTFRPEDYQNALAEWDLDRSRLESLLLHRHCGLVADPRWGDTSLAFPFAVYEAKGWSGDARVARHQACAAGAVYLDMLDNLTRQPGKVGQKTGEYQSSRSHESQVFAFTSFGAHWHILVGYKRPRLRREYAGRVGMSKSVYVFQRIWSGRVTTERKAWELLSLIDQIHLWGATDFRQFVMRHLQPWHAFAENCYNIDAFFLHKAQGFKLDVRDDGGVSCNMPLVYMDLAGWVQHITDDARAKLRDKLGRHVAEACIQFPGAQFRGLWVCNEDGCTSSSISKYPMNTLEELIRHFSVVHGVSDDEIAEFVQNCESWQSNEPQAGSVTTNPPSERRGLKRHAEDATGTAKDQQAVNKRQK